METRAKKLHCPSSYQGLNRLFLGQISDPLRLRKESYCNVKLKWPDTGQHTVPFENRKKAFQQEPQSTDQVNSFHFDHIFQ